MASQCEHGSPADACPLCEANAELAALRAEVERLRAAPTTEAAAAMGAIGAEAAGVPHNESERLAFEAWIRGHCWMLCAEWKDGGYRANNESPGFVSPAATETRRMWAAWRDRAALAQSVISALRTEIAELRAEVDRLRGHLQDSINAETSGYMVLLKNLGTHWEISVPNVTGDRARIPHWPCDAEALRTYMPTSTPEWFILRAMKLAKRWLAAFGDGGAA